MTAGLQTRTGVDLLAWIADNLRRDADFRRDLQVGGLEAVHDDVAAAGHGRDAGPDPPNGG
ncbi:hypothetical protein [Embleya sp. NPDC059237]|uniref:hypothetical protein n=1 Tax=Embleya sp. NPDC059237 TaxID=3346784 RepID=UPI0036C42814